MDSYHRLYIVYQILSIDCFKIFISILSRFLIYKRYELKAKFCLINLSTLLI